MEGQNGANVCKIEDNAGLFGVKQSSVAETYHEHIYQYEKTERIPQTEWNSFRFSFVFRWSEEIAQSSNLMRLKT